MILREFMDNNSDILRSRITAEELPRVTEYQVLLMVTLSRSRTEQEKPVEEREILNVRHIMPIFNGKCEMQYITETDYGNAKACYITVGNLKGLAADRVLFYTVPFAYDDTRRQLGWRSWNQVQKGE